MFKCSTLAASITGLALGLATSAAFADDKPVYGVLMKTLSNPFWGAIEKGVDGGGKTPRVGVFDHPLALPQAGERDEDPSRRPRQQSRSRNHQKGRRRHRLPHRPG